jgi:hypothetical protein
MPDGARSDRQGAPLRSNRDLVLLQTGQLLSTAGTQLSAIAYPLLVPALTHSSAKAGIVGFARVAPYALFGLVAGLVSDRVDRRRLMVGSDVARMLALGTLVAAIALDRVPFAARRGVPLPRRRRGVRCGGAGRGPRLGIRAQTPGDADDPPRRAVGVARPARVRRQAERMRADGRAPAAERADPDHGLRRQRDGLTVIRTGCSAG